MLKVNYKPWHVDASNFDHGWPDIKKLLYFARYAILAPSGHNTQPWLLSKKDDVLCLAIHPNHHLSIDGSGLLSVEPYISIGTFLEAMELAAKGFGYLLTIDLHPGKEQLAEIKIAKKVEPKPALLEAIKTRVSNRNYFETTKLSLRKLHEIIGPTFKDIDTVLVNNREDIEFIGAQTEVALSSIMSHPLYRLELSKWVRVNHTKRYDGMPGFTHGFGNIQSLVSKVAVKHAPSGGPQGKKSRNLIVNSGALVIVCCKKDDQESFIHAGQIYTQICVLANADGIATSALGAAVLDPVTRKVVKEKFDIKDRPIYILRLGKPLRASRHSPRWPLEKLMVN